MRVINHKSKARTECSECGKYPEKLHRRYKDNTYCQACYQRVFKHRNCPQCSGRARLPIYNLEAICHRCEKSKPCIRCGVQGEKLGKITEIGPVCNKCYPYFVEPMACSSCGKTSRRYSYNQVQGNHSIVCYQCSFKKMCGTCHKCHRYRKLFFIDEYCKGICKICRDEGVRLCEACEQPFPAGYGKVCEKCYWSGVLNQRKSITLHLFATQAVKKVFENFADWLEQRRGAAVAAMELNKYSQILYEIENEWGYVPDYKCLVQHFSVAKMRRFKRFFDWLIESCMVQVEQSVKDDDSQRNQTRKIIDSANIGPKMSMVILNYFKNLTNPKRKRRLSLRTVRLYLRSATSLAIHCRAKGDIIPEQSDLNSFLSTKPGHQASLHPFITYLRAEGIAALSVQRQPATSINKNNRDKLKKSLFKVIHAAHEGEFTNGRLWNTLALQYFHGVSKKDSYRILKQGKYASDDNGVIYMFMDKGMWIPNITYCLDLV